MPPGSSPLQENQGLMGSCWKSMVQMGAYMAHRKKSKSGLQPVPEEAGKHRQFCILPIANFQDKSGDIKQEKKNKQLPVGSV
ncbi:hypothetical protein EYF80_015690 [Liparis tanakae]|uniref:Uncharacterized protein n=1 Tax=Liparis tanakae TaxID=230148 RepID=A0A4Z2I7N2_9TELE|nr:hypothetical protein EYF80_015690 [Liparis tanakae]